MQCNCGSGFEFNQCCEPLLLDRKAPTTAERLMRSRYVAFATKNVDYILKTEKLKRPNQRKALIAFLNEITYVKLQVLHTNKGQENDNQGTVTFEATFFNNGQLQVMKEKSSFKKIKDDWYYCGTL